MKFSGLLFSVILLFNLTACSSSRKPVRNCPLGGMTEISASGQDAQNMALKMAANSTLRDGYDKFSIVSGHHNLDTYVMLVRMFHAQENTDIYKTISARDIVPAPVFQQSDI